MTRQIRALGVGLIVCFVVLFVQLNRLTVFQAAEQGQVHLVQRRRGPFDFSYLAIKSVRAATRRAVARSPLCSEAA